MAITSRLRPGKGRPKPGSSPDGRMTLTEHLRELRNRIFVSLFALVVGFCIAWYLYGPIYDLLIEPFKQSVKTLNEARDGKSDIKIVINTVGGSFLLQTKISLVAGIVISSPVWLYELWAFILPGLHRNEKKWTYVFIAIAGPLFAAGVALGYYVMPKGFSVLLGFTPDGVSNYIDSSHYLDFVIRVLLVFGVSFEIPLFVVLLNLAGVVRARQLSKWRSWIIFATFVFAAVATPSTDPITMLLLAFPMVALFLISEVIAHLVDRRRFRLGEPDYAELDDDEQSPI